MTPKSLFSHLFPLLSAGMLYADARPNILVVVADDQSWINAGAYGDKAARTPNFDALSQNGVRFTQAYCSSPSCSPSRAAILAGRPFSTLEEAANLRGSLQPRFTVYPEKLQAAGYAIGHTGKGWGPGDIYAGGRTVDPFGPWFMNGAAVDKKADESKAVKSPQKWAKNLEAFLDTDEGKPFCFWFGSKDPHRPYKPGTGEGIDKAAITVPPFFPDVPEVRDDLAAYLGEISSLDQDLGDMISLLKARGLLENTIIIYTSDNGMPFPRCKGFLYDYGTRMPLAVQWPAKIPRGHVVDDFVSLIDLAPTILEAAGVPVPAEMTGKSLLPILLAGRDGRIEQDRDKVFLGRERHSRERVEGKQQVGYPMRAVRTDEFLYIRNFKPDRVPAGDSGSPIDTDPSPTRQYMADHKTDPADARLWELSFGKRPAEELYDLKKDPFEMNNVAADPAYSQNRDSLRAVLDGYLQEIKDPRSSTGGDIFDSYSGKGGKGE